MFIMDMIDPMDHRRLKLACPVKFATTTTVDAIQQTVVTQIRYRNKRTHSYKMEKVQDKFGRFRDFVGRTVQSNKMFVISNCLLGLESKSKPETRPSADDDRRAKKIREKAGRFRILIIGRANAGKTTILQKVCNTAEQPEIFDSEGNKVRRCSAKYWPGAYDTD